MREPEAEQNLPFEHLSLLRSSSQLLGRSSQCSSTELGRHSVRCLLSTRQRGLKVSSLFRATAVMGSAVVKAKLLLSQREQNRACKE